MTSVFCKFLCVAAGSGLGGMCRYAVGRLAPLQSAVPFPWATFAVNILGCFIIGLIYGLLDRGFTLSESMRLFLTVGFCGGFTTFSTFMHENYLLSHSDGLWWIILYATSSLAAGLVMLYAGHTLPRLLS